MGNQAKKEEAKVPAVREAQPDEFPKMLYFKGDVSNSKIVNSVVEEDEAGEDWWDAPTEG